MYNKYLSDVPQILIDNMGSSLSLDSLEMPEKYCRSTKFYYFYSTNFAKNETNHASSMFILLNEILYFILYIIVGNVFTFCRMQEKRTYQNQ